jgi:hypothetical protein
MAMGTTDFASLDQLSDKIPVRALLSFNGTVQQAFTDSMKTSNINKLLILENLLISWMRAIRARL